MKQKGIKRIRTDLTALKWYSPFFYVLVVGIIIISIFIISDLFDGELNGKSKTIPASAKFEFDRTETITAQRSSIDYILRTYFPPDLPPEGTAQEGNIQLIRSLQCTPSPDTPLEMGERMIWQKKNHLGTDTITIRYEVDINTVKWNIDTSDSGTLADIDNEALRDQYLGDQWAMDTNNDKRPDDLDSDGVFDNHMIEPSNPHIKSAAEMIADNQQNVYDIVWDVYNYMTVSGGFEYSLGRQGTPARASETILTKKGDCDDQSILMISILRSLEIPSWLTLGLLYDEKSGEWFGHAWTNVYIPLKDGSYEVATIDVVNELFLFRTCHHLAEWSDDGIKDSFEGGVWTKSHLAEYYYYFEYNYKSRPPPRVFEDEEFNTIYYKTSGSVTYDNENSEATWVKEVPDLNGFIISAVFILVVIYYYRTNK